jgi:hypothetical protein
MMGVHVANSANTKVYFVIDPNGNRDTGALVYPTGSVSFFNFWGWVSANPEIQKLEENEFQQMLWDEPLPQDEDLWESVFFSRETPLSGIIDPTLVVNLGGKQKEPKQQPMRETLAKQVMERGATNEQ